MQRLLLLTLLIFNLLIDHSFGECPKARFQFKNQTTWAFYNFLQSYVGNIGSLETCPYTGRPYVYLPCYTNSSWGDEPYFSSCIEPPTTTTSSTTKTTTTITTEPLYLQLSLKEMIQFPMNSSKDIEIILAYLNEAGIMFNSSMDVSSVVDILDRLTTSQTIPNNLEIHSKYFSLVNQLLSTRFTTMMKEAQINHGSLVKLISSVETYNRHLITNETNLSFVQSNFAVSIVNQPNDRSEPIIGFVSDVSMKNVQPIRVEDQSSNRTSIILSRSAIIDRTRLIFSIYDEKTRLFDTVQYRLVTPLISLTIDPSETIRQLGSFVKINFRLDPEYRERNLTFKCAHWNLLTKTNAQWSTKGCQLTVQTEDRLTCLCDHLTHFAVLMDVEQSTTPRLVEQVLSIITLLGFTLSSTGLCLTILTFLLFKKLRRHFSQKALLFLSINLLLTNIFFSIIDLYTLDQLKDLLCIIIGSFLHYFVVSSFSWMFIIALIQYLLFVKVFPQTVSAFTRKATAFAQLISLIPVVTILAIDPKLYTKRTDGICWLTDLPFYLAFILPIALYILINSIFFITVTYSFLCSKTRQHLRSTQMAESHRLSRFILAWCCFILLTITWIFSLFAVGSIRLVFQIIFCIAASLTGLSIFILYLLTSKAKQNCWNNTLKSFAMPSIYSPSSSSSGFHSNKEFSISSGSDQQKVPTRRLQFPSQPQHFIDAYMPSSPPPPAPPLLPPTQPSLIIEGDDPLCSNTMNNQFYESRHTWTSQNNYMYDSHQPITSLDDYSLFYASNHDATKL